MRPEEASDLFQKVFRGPITYLDHRLPLMYKNVNTPCPQRAPLLFFSCSVMSDSFVTLWTLASQAPLSMGLPRQEYWSGLPFPSLGDLPNPGIEPRAPELQAESLPTELQGKPSFRIDWFELLAVQGTLKSLLQHHSLKASILQCLAFFMVCHICT